MLTRGGAKVLHLYSRINFKLNRGAALAGCKVRLAVRGLQEDTFALLLVVFLA